MSVCDICEKCGHEHDSTSLGEKGSCLFYWVDRARERALQVSELEARVRELLNSLKDFGDHHTRMMGLPCPHQDRLARAEAALNEIACWDEGPKVNGSFDEPGSAEIAREYFKESPGHPEKGCLKCSYIDGKVYKLCGECLEKGEPVRIPYKLEDVERLVEAAEKVLKGMMHDQLGPTPDCDACVLKEALRPFRAGEKGEGYIQVGIVSNPPKGKSGPCHNCGCNNRPGIIQCPC